MISILECIFIIDNFSAALVPQRTVPVPEAGQRHGPQPQNRLRHAHDVAVRCRLLRREGQTAQDDPGKEYFQIWALTLSRLSVATDERT